MRPVRRTLLAALLLATSAAFAGDAVNTLPKPKADSQAKAQSIDTSRPMKWMIEAQGPDGGWGTEKGAPPDVATTAISTIALIRAGHTLSGGEHEQAVRKGVDFIVKAIERVPHETLEIQGPGTQPQAKLGRYIDTYLAAQALGEASPGANTFEDRRKVSGALDIVIGKVLALQRRDGSFAGEGWAPVLSSAFAHGGLYAARAAGSRVVTTESIEKANKAMEAQYDARKKQFDGSKSAGVPLYSAGASLGAAARNGQVDGEAAKAARAAIQDEAFLRGFGTYGGEEHVSYMMTSEALAKVGGKEWTKWDKNIRERLTRIQRQDGTWRGDHCITSTTFCTAASLITLAIKAPSAAKPEQPEQLGSR